MAYSKADKYGLVPVSKDDPSFQSNNAGSFVNLDMLDVHGLTGELIEKYNKNNDIGVIGSWFRQRKLDASEKHLQALFSLVTEVRKHSANLHEFKAQLVAQHSVLQYRIGTIIDEARFAMDRQRADHQLYLHGHDVERRKRELELERLRLENMLAALQVEKMQAEVALDQQKVALLGQKGALIEKIIGELNFQDINMKQVFVLIEMVKDSRTNADILTAEAQWQRMKAEANMAEAKAEQEQHQTQYKAWKMDQEMKIPNE